VQQIWKPTAPGRFFTKTPEWSLELNDEQFALTVQGQGMRGHVELLAGLVMKPGTFWAQLIVHGAKGNVLLLDGIPNTAALTLTKAVSAAIDRKRYRDKVAELIKNFDIHIRPVVNWARTTVESCKSQLSRRGWLSREFMNRTRDAKPKELSELLLNPEIERHLDKQSDSIKTAVQLWRKPFEEFISGINRRHAEKVVKDNQTFFDSVEKSPLTAEQREAVICLDSRVLLVASAGSGKTSTMVAKAGYALQHGYFSAEKMLLLAFNNDAAAELRERIQTRLMPLGLPADKVVAKTFHAFGLDVIGIATGKRPSLAPWLENSQDFDALLKMADTLRDSDSVFRTNWDLFRLVFGQDLPKFGQEQESPDSWDSQQRRGGFWTLNNEVVKSRGEAFIANWLFYNGVRYVYEGTYEHETADATHRQYKPDFYLPDAQAYLEHWALDEKGDPPKEFVGYKDGMTWKRNLHAQHGTRLLETTMAQLWSGKAFKYLADELPKLGVALDPNPDRETPAGTNLPFVFDTCQEQQTDHSRTAQSLEQWCRGELSLPARDVPSAL
jgi:DNA helicase-4